MKFDVKEENLSVFTDALMDRSQEIGWDNHQVSIPSLPIIWDRHQVHLNLIEEFRRFTPQELRTHILTYYTFSQETLKMAI